MKRNRGALGIGLQNLARILCNKGGNPISRTIRLLVKMPYFQALKKKKKEKEEGEDIFQSKLCSSAQ